MFERWDGEPLRYDDAKGAKLVERALDGDADVDAALCEIAFKYVLSGREMPHHLRVYIMLLLRRRFEAPGRRGRGGDKYANLSRNRFIVGVLEWLKASGF
jgi:hypothetical protein